MRSYTEGCDLGNKRVLSFNAIGYGDGDSLKRFIKSLRAMFSVRLSRSNVALHNVDSAYGREFFKRSAKLLPRIPSGDFYKSYIGYFSNDYDKISKILYSPIVQAENFCERLITPKTVF